MPGELPVVTLGLTSATIYYEGVTDRGVDLKAAEGLKAICDAYPHSVGISTACGDKATRVFENLPERFVRMVTRVGNKGYTLLKVH